MAKIRNFASFGGGVPTFFAPINVKFGMVRSPVPNFTLIGATCRPRLLGGKPIFGPLSKNNIGMAALGAGLPVIK